MVQPNFENHYVDVQSLCFKRLMNRNDHALSLPLWHLSSACRSRGMCLEGCLEGDGLPWNLNRYSKWPLQKKQRSKSLFVYHFGTNTVTRYWVRASLVGRVKDTHKKFKLVSNYQVLLCVHLVWNTHTHTHIYIMCFTKLQKKVHFQN